MQKTNLIEQAVLNLKEGKLVVFPTETVYGLGADATNKEALAEIFRLKGRPSDNPLIVHIYSLEQALLFAQNPPPLFYALAARFWPGPLTMVLPKKPDVSHHISGNTSKVGLRMPNSPLMLAVMQKGNLAIAAPSANLSGRPSPTRIEHCMEDFGPDTLLYLDGGPLSLGIESTVLDLSTDPPLLLRPGALATDELFPFTGPLNTKDTGEIASPGMKYRHYAPVGNLILLTPDITPAPLDKQTGILWDWRCPSWKNLSAHSFYLGQNLNEVAQNLYHGLRSMDSCKVQRIYCPIYPDEGLGLSLMNRLRKAAHK